MQSSAPWSITSERRPWLRGTRRTAANSDSFDPTAYGASLKEQMTALNRWRRNSRSRPNLKLRQFPSV
jgi:hypothetical protein